MKHPPVKEQVRSAIRAAAERGWKVPADFPAEVHESLRLLYLENGRGAKRGDMRFATPDEIALAELQRDPYRCTASSNRTGLPCRRWPIVPGTICVHHGARLPQVKEANDRRLADISNRMIGELVKVATSPQISKMKVMAAIDLLDRAGVGAIAEAKVRASYHKAGMGDVTVQIGFLQMPQGDTNAEEPQNVIEAQIEERAALPAPADGAASGAQDADDRSGDGRLAVDAPRAAGTGD